MAKTPSATPAADLSHVMSFVANRSPEPALPAEAAVPPAAEPPVPAEAPTPTAGPIIKKEAPATETESVDYAENFLRPVRKRKSKAIYVDEDTHNALAVITQAAGVGLADLLINLTNHHFEVFRPAIRQFLNDWEKQNKKKLPY